MRTRLARGLARAPTPRHVGSPCPRARARTLTPLRVNQPCSETSATHASTSARTRSSRDTTPARASSCSEPGYIRRSHTADRQTVTDRSPGPARLLELCSRRLIGIIHTAFLSCSRERKTSVATPDDHRTYRRLLQQRRVHAPL